jgi:hypothetical protein
MATVDKETKEILSDGEEVRLLTESRGWGVIKAKLDGRILDLQNINNLDLSDIKTLPAQLAGRKMAVDEIWAWLKADVYGFAEQQSTNAQSFIDENTNGFIDRA